MKRFQGFQGTRPGRATRGRGGFTGVELMVVLGTLAAVVALLGAGVSTWTRRSQRQQCAENLRRLGMACQMYGERHAGRLPAPREIVCRWVWDLERTTVQEFLTDGVKRQEFYCPANRPQNCDRLWNFEPRFRVLGYQHTFANNRSLFAENRNYWLRPGGVEPAHRVLMADIVLCDPRGRFAQIHGEIDHRTSHLRFGKPQGGNQVFLDGHCEWRPFGGMFQRSSLPAFFY